MKIEEKRGKTPTIRVVEMENSHHRYNHNGSGGTLSSVVAVPPPTTDESELSIFDAQKYFNENPNPEKPKSNTITSIMPSISPPPLPPYVSDLPTSLPRRLSSSSAADSRKNYFSFPTASSEASWNSQTGLLANRSGSFQVNMKSFPSNRSEPHKSESSFSWFSWLKCPCAGKKSVRVHGGGTPSSVAGNNYTHQKRENHKLEVGRKVPQIISTQKETTVPVSLSSDVGDDHDSPPPAIMVEPRQQRISSSGIGNPFVDGNANSVAFSFPILNQTFPAPSPKIEVLRRVLPLPLVAANDPPRDSLEVFQPQSDSIPSNPMLFANSSGGSSGGGGRSLPFLGSPTKAAIDDEVASDASSDLFEIESFSTQQTSSTYPMYYYQRRDSLEEATTFNARQRLTVAATTGGETVGRNSYSRRSIDEEEIMNEYGYEPSEVSIDWSITTAEGFDQASMTNYSIAASKMEETSMTRRGWEGHNGGIEGGKGKNNKVKGMGLLSCQHEKAVGSMGSQLMRCSTEEGHGGAGAARAVGPMHPFQFMNTFRHVNGRVATNKPNKPPLVGTSHSDRLSLGFTS